MTSDHSKKMEVSIGDLVATNMSSSIGEVLIQFLNELFEDVYDKLTSGRIGIIPEQSEALRLLHNTHILNNTLHPGDFIMALGSRGHISVLKSEHLEDSH